MPNPTKTNFAAKCFCRRAGQSVSLLLLMLVFCLAAFAQEDDDDFIDPTRPTVSESATIQKKGVLQFEHGGDFDFDALDFRNRKPRRSI